MKDSKRSNRPSVHYHGRLAFPPSQLTTSATVNLYKTAESEELPDSDMVWVTDAELAAELRRWSIENKL